MPKKVIINIFDFLLFNYITDDKMEQIIDLTYDIEEGMTTFNAPWHPTVSIKQMGRIGMEGRETRKLSLGTHTGTHVDAPLHFIKNGTSIDKIPLSKLIGDITIIDYSSLEENKQITKEMLEKNKISKKCSLNLVGENIGVLKNSTWTIHILQKMLQNF